MKELVDANVWLDVALQRPGLARASQDALNAWHTLSNIYYIVRRAENRLRAETFIKAILASSLVITVTHTDALVAASLGMNDFEDALQVAAAQAHGADVLLTRNVADFAAAAIPIYTPEAFALAFGSSGTAP